MSTRDDELLSYLQATPPAWIVTRTRRLARDLTLRVARLRAEDGRAVTDTPPIRCLDDWLQELGARVLASEAADGSASATGGRVLLSSIGAQVLWERAISCVPSDLPGELLDTSALAATAADAWGRLCVWGEPSWSGPLARDVEEFSHWLPIFRQHLAAGGFLTSAELSALVAQALEAGQLEEVRPGVAVVLGFERESPEILRIVEAMRARGTTVKEGFAAAPRAAVEPVVWLAASPAQEVRTVAATIHQRLLQQPNLRIAVLTPDLSAYGKRLERVFEEELDPQGIADIGSTSSRRFDYAEAPALGDYALVADALDLLGVDGDGVAFETVSRLLLSAYPRRADEAGRHDRVRRGELEAKLRRSRSAVLRLAGRKGSIATEARELGLVANAERLETLDAHLQGVRGTRRSPSGWRREWIKRLEILAWPGVLLADAEGLAFRRWRDALDDFAQLEAVEPMMDAAHALDRLRSICSAARVQPASEGLSVQVMNLLDAEGLEFDVVFVIGMTATAFPPAPRPNPLLPVAWQRAQKGMPRASVEGERTLADKVWERVLRSAPEVIASYPASGDGREDNTPSSYLAGLPCAKAEEGSGQPWWLAWSQGDLPREARPVDVVPPPLVRRGGSSMVTNQSNCPFRGFAVARLGAEKLEEISPQPDAARRGTLVHAALSNAYTSIPTSDDLAGQSDQNLDEVARAAAKVAIDDNRSFFEDADDLADAAGLWLEEMVASWMRHERDERTGFWAAEELEKGFELPFPAGAADHLTISFRPDRIDRIEDDGFVILDFKTSATAKTPSLWGNDRPEDPQLPLYLALLESEGRRIDGIAFANLSARDQCLLTGWGAADYSAKFRPPGRTKARSRQDYDDRIAQTRAVLEGMAVAYLGGDARVEPKSTKVCGYCACQALCRVGEGVGLADDDEDGEPS